MPNENPGGHPTATQEQLLEFHSTVIGYVLDFSNNELFTFYCTNIFYNLNYLLDSDLLINFFLFLIYRADNPKTVVHALRNFTRLYR